MLVGNGGDADPLHDDMVLLRRVSAQNLVSDDNDDRLRASTAAFKQGGPDGDVSVHLWDLVDSDQVAQGGTEQYLVWLTVGDVRRIGLDVAFTPTDNEPGHCDIVGRKTAARSRQLARASQWLPGYGPLGN